jgi:hypothetical protein
MNHLDPDRLSSSNRPAGAEQYGAIARDTIATLVARVHKRLPKMKVPRQERVEPGGETAWKLRAVWTPFDVPDTSGSSGLRGPAAGLTDDDLRRLRILSNVSGVPMTKLMHAAAGVLFDEVRQALLDLLEDQASPVHEDQSSTDPKSFSSAIAEVTTAPPRSVARHPSRFCAATTLVTTRRCRESAILRSVAFRPDARCGIARRSIVRASSAAKLAVLEGVA